MLKYLLTLASVTYLSSALATSGDVTFKLVDKLTPGLSFCSFPAADNDIKLGGPLDEVRKFSYCVDSNSTYTLKPDGALFLNGKRVNIGGLDKIKVGTKQYLVFDDKSTRQFKIVNGNSLQDVSTGLFVAMLDQHAGLNDYPKPWKATVVPVSASASDKDVINAVNSASSA
ncbi:hypothetical protein MIR68_004767 [Amoeboaphelidium protococcarum]|nr:hypothetical protein MIR68_004767 [Amoeboaphelidium protococcarum]